VISVTQERFIQIIQELQNYNNPPTNQNLLFRFENSTEAALHNAIVLEQYNFNVNDAITAQDNSQVMFGSEFKHPTFLEELLHDHPNWKHLKQILLFGATFPLKPISDKDRMLDLDYHFQRGNHKSAIDHKTILDKLIDEDITRGFALPLPIQLYKLLPLASIAPLGCQEQETINERGEKIPKHCMTHDQSFPGPSGLSVNLRVDKQSLPPCMYSFVLSRILHYIVDLRRRHPSTRIYMCKFDLDSAYRRCHLSSLTSTECLTIHNNMLLMALRMTFGGSPCPSMWGYISDTMIDICNSLIVNPHWNHNIIFDPISDKLSSFVSLPDSEPFHQAHELSVSLPINDIGISDIYIDDSIGVSPDIDSNPLRVNRAIPLAIQTLARPLNPDDPIPRNPIISQKKLLAEGKMEECKIILGWHINTRSLLISLPKDKHEKWITQIDQILNLKRVSTKQLEILIGRLNHIGAIISMIRHFLSRLRQALFRSLKNGWTCLRHTEKSDLHLMKTFIDKAMMGISLNNVVFRKPTHIYRSDASEFGLGGYNLITGHSWRFELPLDCRLRSSLNSLEFIACIINIWIDIIVGDVPPESCFLSQTDSSTATGWLRKSNFADESETAVQLTSARQLVSLVMNTDSCLYSQWFAGDLNAVSDCLSRDFHLTDSALTNLLQTCVPNQVPFGFFLSPLPTEISSWLTCLLRNQPFKEEWSKEPTRSKLSLGDVSNYTYSPSASKMTGSSKPSTADNNTESLEHLQLHSEKVDFLLQNLLNSEVTQSVPPWIAYHRPSSWLTNQTHASTSTETLHSFYNANYDATQT
jgi:hypothetical protein